MSRHREPPASPANPPPPPNAEASPFRVWLPGAPVPWQRTRGAFDYAFGDPAWPFRYAKLALITLIPVVGYMALLGWQVRVFESVRLGRRVANVQVTAWQDDPERPIAHARDVGLVTHQAGELETRPPRRDTDCNVHPCLPRFLAAMNVGIG